MSGETSRRNPRRKYIFLLGLLLLAAGILLFVCSHWPGSRFGVFNEDVLVHAPPEGAARDALVVTQGRLDYRRGEMVLLIPVLDLETPVAESTLPEVLRGSPGLYEFSQMPGEGDVNVSIAGHRDVYGMEFYALDRLGEGDALYLLYGGAVYRYRYLDTAIVAPDNWEVIRRQGFSCLTLTTCDPVGTTLNRLIVRAELVGREPLGVDNTFLPKLPPTAEADSLN